MEYGVEEKKKAAIKTRKKTNMRAQCPFDPGFGYCFSGAYGSADDNGNRDGSSSIVAARAVRNACP